MNLWKPNYMRVFNVLPEAPNLNARLLNRTGWNVAEGPSVSATWLVPAIPGGQCPSSCPFVPSRLLSKKALQAVRGREPDPRDDVWPLPCTRPGASDLPAGVSSPGFKGRHEDAKGQERKGGCAASRREVADRVQAASWTSVPASARRRCNLSAESSSPLGQANAPASMRARRK